MVTPSVVNRGASLRRRVPGVIDWVAMRPSPFPGMEAIFQRLLGSGVGDEVPFGGESGSVVRLGAMVMEVSVWIWILSC